ncbi:S1/P1 nuclease [Qipengyuania sp.]|uniref:S1/P1 nuclease n=1 Tax=Qipengyuania sp. TaxID=2004515 RepID=UPI0035C84339
MGHRTIRGAARLISALLLALCPGPLLAWGFYAHTVTGEIAAANIAPSTRAAIARLYAAEPLLGTPDCPLDNLEQAAVWPDCIRRDYNRWGYTAAWHYQTEPITEPYDVRKNCSGGNCVSAQIARNQRLLADESLPANVRLEALSFLVHFVGDIHMPLHSGDLEDRGGNDRTVAYGIVPGLNLHWIWDGPLAERAISEDPPVVRRYSPAEREALAGGEIADWGRESWQLARQEAYPLAFGCDPCDGSVPKDGTLSQEAIAEGVPFARRRVVQAGLRIARLLDEAMRPGPLPECAR